MGQEEATQGRAKSCVWHPQLSDSSYQNLATLHRQAIVPGAIPSSAGTGTSASIFVLMVRCA